MFLIARDPHWLFTYWDFDYAKFPPSRKLFIEVYRNDELESTVEINEIARNWYIPGSIGRIALQSGIRLPGCQ